MSPLKQFGEEESGRRWVPRATGYCRGEQGMLRRLGRRWRGGRQRDGDEGGMFYRLEKRNCCTEKKKEKKGGISSDVKKEKDVDSKDSRKEGFH